MCVCWGAHTCVLSGRWGSLLIPAQRVPPPQTSGRRGPSRAGEPGPGPLPCAQHPYTRCLRGTAGGGLPSRAPGLRGPPCFPPGWEAPCEEGRGWGAVTPLAWVSLCWSPGEAHLTSLLLSAAAGRTHGWEQGGTRDRIFSKWGRVPGHPERTSAWPPALPPSFGTALAFVNKWCGLCCSRASVFASFAEDAAGPRGFL